MSLTAKQNIHITTDNNLAITTNKDLSLATTSKYNLTVQNGIRVFVQTGGIKHYTAKDDIELQAQDGQIKHIAKDNIEIISTEGKIQITSPTQLSINICGSEFKMNEQGVFITTPGVFQVKSNEKVMEGGEYVEIPIYKFHSQNFMELNYHWEDLEPVKGAPYLVEFENGQRFEGFLDDDGYAKIENVPIDMPYEVWYGEDQRDINIEIPDKPMLDNLTTQELIEIEQFLSQYDLADNNLDDDNKVTMQDIFGEEND
ncbi:DUF2345 domain-containing protein [Moraxella bovis]|nr:DUF2345 domain-containing protein [Moraxella bovis]UYZ69698.1 DUF2345 domain-containing protein [Moraxella bovis]